MKWRKKKETNKQKTLDVATASQKKRIRRESCDNL
jgi:hypothetical protein